MSSIARLFLDNLLPILLIAAAGFFLARFFTLQPRTLSRVVFYIFSPCLMFKLIVTSQLTGGDVLRMGGLAVLLLVAVGALTWMAGRLLRLDKKLLIALLLSTMFMNAGNFGLSLTSFAFGESALAHASLFFAAQGILSYTVGLLLASLGKYPPQKALSGLLKIPMLYALALALVVARFDIRLPLALDRTIDVLSGAAIPAMLVLLGLQLHTARWTGRSLTLGLANTVRLVISPMLALLLAAPLGLVGAARQAGVIEAATPTAVMTIVLATEYDIEPAFVTAAVFSSTLLSPLTVTPLLAYLGAS